MNACIAPVPDAPDFRVGPDPELGSQLGLRAALLARAKGRLAARLAVSQYFPNDVAALAKEVPRVDRWCPLQSPDGLLDQVSQGKLSPTEAMDRLILIMAPRQAWKLYNEVASTEPWESAVLHRLLDLLCATNSGAGGAHPHPLWDEVDLSCPPDPDEVYFAEELTIHFARQSASNRGDRRSAVQRNVEEGQEDGVEPLEGEESEEVSSEGSTGDLVDSSKLQTSTDATVRTTGPTSWLVHGAAEQLFSKERKTLNTPAAFCSMIRGASRFSRPERALELAELAWKSLAEGNSCLDVPTYTGLIRSLHCLESVKSDHHSLWPLVRSIVDRLIASGQAIDVSVFSAILFCLAQTVSNGNKSTEATVTEQYVAIGLAVLDELRKTGLEPSMGVFANLLRIIHYARAPPMPGTNKTTNVSCKGLVKNFVSELEYRFTVRQPSRADEWTPDDYSFFPVAMRIASLEGDLSLGQRIDRLLTRGPDLRWLLATSLLRRAYVLAYSSLVLDSSAVNYSANGQISDTSASLLQKMQNVDKLYRAHWGSIATTNKQAVRFANTISGHLRASCGERKNQQLASLAYACFDSFFNHLTERTRAMDFSRQVGLRVVELSHVLSEFAHCAPHLAAKTSASMLTRLKAADERAASQNMRKTGSRQPLPKLPNHLVQNLVRMTFPALEMEAFASSTDASQADNVHWSRRAFTTLHGWLVFTTDREILDWSWAPKVIHTVFKNTEKGDCEKLIWDGLRQLSRLTYEPNSQSEYNTCKSALVPVLEELEANLPALVSATSGFVSTYLNADERCDLMSNLRRMLEDAAAAAARKVEQLETDGQTDRSLIRFASG